MLSLISLKKIAVWKQIQTVLRQSMVEKRGVFWRRQSFWNKISIQKWLTVCCCISEAIFYADISKGKRFKLLKIFIFCRFSKKKLNREKTIFSSYFAKESISNMRRFHEHNRLEMFRNMHHLHSNSVELYKKSVVFVVEIDHWVKLSKLKTRIVTDFGSNWDHFAICSCSVLCWWQCFIDI